MSEPTLALCPKCKKPPFFMPSTEPVYYSYTCCQGFTSGWRQSRESAALEWNTRYGSVNAIACSDASERTKRVIQQLLDRDAAGKQKYGTTLDRDDLTTLEWLQHAQEEALDLAGYLEVLKGRVESEENLRRRAEDAEAELARINDSLKQPHVVHINLLRGAIALTKAQAIHYAGLPAGIEERTVRLETALSRCLPILLATPTFVPADLLAEVRELMGEEQK